MAQALQAVSEGCLGNPTEREDRVMPLWIAARRSPASLCIHRGGTGPDEELRLRVGDRCLTDGAPKVVIIDSVEYFGVPGCYGATYLTGPSFTVALRKHLRFFYPESEAGQSALPGFEPSVAF